MKNLNFMMSLGLSTALFMGCGNEKETEDTKKNESITGNISSSTKPKTEKQEPDLRKVYDINGQAIELDFAKKIDEGMCTDIGYVLDADFEKACTASGFAIFTYSPGCSSTFYCSGDYKSYEPDLE